MSVTAFGNSKAIRRLCQACQDRKARFAFRGRVKADRDHTLCFECYRAERDRRRALALTEVPARQAVLPFGNARPLNAAAIAHRRRILEHLTSQAAGR
jgi:hypothetical protein